MKLELEFSGREVVVLPPGQGSSSRAGLWQGKTENGIPVLAVIAVLSPLVPAEDSRQAEFELARDQAMDPTRLHRDVEAFPAMVQL